MFFRVLSDDQVWEIKQAAFDILEKTGCEVLHAGALELLKQAGAVVKDERVWVPRHIVEECVRTAPKGFTIYDRDGNRAMEVEGRKSYYGTSTASPNTRDAFSGEIRETRVADIALGAKVADALPNIDWVMPMGSSQDVPAPGRRRARIRGGGDQHHQADGLYRLLAPGRRAGLRDGGRGGRRAGCPATAAIPLAYPEPISPLVFPAEVVDRMFIAADLRMPQIPGPTVQTGATGPVTMAGAVAQS